MNKLSKISLTGVGISLMVISKNYYNSISVMIGLFCVFHFYTLNKGIVIETQVMIFELGIFLILCIWVSLIFVYFHNEFNHRLSNAQINSLKLN